MNPVVLVTGLSGAGKASILRALEDLGYEAVDNPPLTLVQTLVARGDRPLAIGLDARTRGFDADGVLATVAELRQVPGRRVELVYAWADTPALLRRYTESRRRHPLSPQGRVADGIEHEAVLTSPLRHAADLVVDTSGLPLPELRRVIERRFMPGTDGPGPLAVTLMSFAFPEGLPREADMVFDARFLRNPHYDPILRSGTGKDPAVAAYVEADPDFRVFYGMIEQMLKLVLPRFVQEGKKYATIAVGCTGGRHRSVRIVERLAPVLRDAADALGGLRQWQVDVLHRELPKDVPPKELTRGEQVGIAGDMQSAASAASGKA